MDESGLALDQAQDIAFRAGGHAGIAADAQAVIDHWVQRGRSGQTAFAILFDDLLILKVFFTSSSSLPDEKQDDGQQIEKGQQGTVFQLDD